jgi:hypothetical protein
MYEYLILILICLVCIITFFSYRKRETFENVRLSSFDDVLDDKCNVITETKRPDYIWKSKNNCAEATCPKETCYIRKKNNCRKNFIRENTQYGWKLGYMWFIERQPTVYDTESKQCVSKHDEDNGIFCSGNESFDITKKNIEDGLYTDLCKMETCYELEDNTLKEKRYINLMNRDGEINWHDISNLGSSNNDVVDCRKEPFDCSTSNYYCCETDEYKDKGLGCKSKKTIYDQYIQFEPNFTTDPYTCVQQNVCDMETCNENDKVNCWKFDKDSRTWNNKVYKKQFVNNNCDFYHTDEYGRLELWANDKECVNFGLEAPISRSSCEASLELEMGQKTLTCDYIEPNGSYVSKTYYNMVDEDGTSCALETRTGDKYIDDIQGRCEVGTNGRCVLSERSYIDTVVDEFCPLLSSLNCPNPEEYLENETSEGVKPMCKSCLPGYYRNDTVVYLKQPGEVNHSSACSPEADCYRDLRECTMLDYETNDNPCPYCLVETSVDNLYEIKFLPQKADKDTCVIDETGVDCIKDGSVNTQITDSSQILYDQRKKEFYPVCFFEDEIFDEAQMKCKKIQTCSESEETCIHNERLKRFTHTNYISGNLLSDCIFQSVDNSTLKLDTCVKECPYGGELIMSENGGGFCENVGTPGGGGGGGGRDTLGYLPVQENSIYEPFHVNFSRAYASILTYLQTYKLEEVCNSNKINEQNILDSSVNCDYYNRKIDEYTTISTQYTSQNIPFDESAVEAEIARFEEEKEKSCREKTEYEEIKRFLSDSYTYYKKVENYLTLLQTQQPTYDISKLYWNNIMDADLEGLPVYTLSSESQCGADSTTADSTTNTIWKSSILANLPDHKCFSIQLPDFEKISVMIDHSKMNKTINRGSINYTFKLIWTSWNNIILSKIYDAIFGEDVYFTTEDRNTVYNPPILPSYHEISSQLSLDNFNRSIKNKRMDSEYYEGFFIYRVDFNDNIESFIDYNDDVVEMFQPYDKNDVVEMFNTDIANLDLLNCGKQDFSTSDRPLQDRQVCQMKTWLEDVFDVNSEDLLKIFENDIVLETDKNGTTNIQMNRLEGTSLTNQTDMARLENEGYVHTIQHIFNMYQSDWKGSKFITNDDDDNTNKSPALNQLVNPAINSGSLQDPLMRGSLVQIHDAIKDLMSKNNTPSKYKIIKHFRGGNGGLHIVGLKIKDKYKNVGPCRTNDVDVQYRVVPAGDDIIYGGNLPTDEQSSAIDSYYLDTRSTSSACYPVDSDKMTVIKYNKGNSCIPPGTEMTNLYAMSDNTVTYVETKCIPRSASVPAAATDCDKNNSAHYEYEYYYVNPPTPNDKESQLQMSIAYEYKLTDDELLDCNEDVNKGISQFYKWKLDNCEFPHDEFLNNDTLDYNTPGKIIQMNYGQGHNPITLKSVCDTPGVQVEAPAPVSQAPTNPPAPVSQAPTNPPAPVSQAPTNPPAPSVPPARDETTITFNYDEVPPDECSTNIQEGTVILVKGDDSVLPKINFTKETFNNKVFIMRFMLCLNPEECSGSDISTYR